MNTHSKFDNLNLNFNYLKNEVDEFGRVEAVLAVDKPAGITSHDVVDYFRKYFHTKKVGHAGTLDPFATGLLIVLVGKNAVKDSEKYLAENKEYIAKIIFGIKTNSGDPEGEILEEKKVQNINETELNQILNSFKPEYLQDVPIFSSVKIKGEKLRELARKSSSFKIVQENDNKYVDFQLANQTKRLKLPNRKVQIHEIKLLKLQKEFVKNEQLNLQEELWCAEIQVKCSKGTYIRQLAIDIGEKLGIPSSLLELRRTTVGEVHL